MEPGPDANTLLAHYALSSFDCMRGTTSTVTYSISGDTMVYTGLNPCTGTVLVTLRRGQAKYYIVLWDEILFCSLES